MKENNKGQAAILIIFVIGMVGLLIGISLSKTGFAESMMGRGTAGSTYAFYVANAGIEDALYKIQFNEGTDEEGSGYGYPTAENYNINIGEGNVHVNISGSRNQRTIVSVGKYKNFVRKLKVKTYNTSIQPDFANVIHADLGGIELKGRTYVEGNVYSNTSIKGRNYNCSANAASKIVGNVWAVDDIKELESSDNGPCIVGNAYANNLYKCRIQSGTAYSANGYHATCPYDYECDPNVGSCERPGSILLPDIGTELMKEYLSDAVEPFVGNCTIGQAGNSCWYPHPNDSVPTIGNIIIDGNLDIQHPLPLFYISGPIWVKGNIVIDHPTDIRLDPNLEEVSMILLAGDNDRPDLGKIEIKQNSNFYANGNQFLLLASEYTNTENDICADEGNVAVKIKANVQSILFYAINDCIIVDVGAGKEYRGSLLGKGVRVETNTEIFYDSLLESAVFSLSDDGGWQISSFTEL
jgi:hypothetical protein